MTGPLVIAPASCSTPGCQGTPEWSPVILMRSASGAAARFVLGLKICTPCKKNHHLRDLMRTPLYNSLVEGFVRQTHEGPEPSLAGLEWISISSEEVLALDRARTATLFGERLITPN